MLRYTHTNASIHMCRSFTKVSIHFIGKSCSHINIKENDTVFLPFITFPILVVTYKSYLF